MLDNLPIHPTTGLRALGWTSRGPIWPVLGGNGEGDGETGDQPPIPDEGQQQQPPAPDEGQQQPPADSGKDGNGDRDQGDGDELAALEPAKLAAMVRKLRGENASDRTNAKQQAAEQARADLAQQIGRALGLVSDDEPADPAKLADQLAERDNELRTLRTERAAEKAARKHGADVDALLDSRSFAAKLDALDPAADDFAELLDALVAETVKTNPKFKTSVGQAPARSSSQHSGGSGSGSFTRQQIAAMSPDEYARNRDAIRKALAAGQIA